MDSLWHVCMFVSYVYMCVHACAGYKSMYVSFPEHLLLVHARTFVCMKYGGGDTEVGIRE